MTYSFEGKRALVTGAGAGIGRATALALAEMGADVIALSRTKATLDTLKQEKPSITTLCVDLSDWQKTREEVAKHLPIHLLVNNAGILINDKFLDAKPEDFDLLYNVNVKAVINVSQVVAKDLIARNLKGVVVNVSSVTSTQSIEGFQIYGGTKAALDSVTRNMALELAPKGIRVNSVNPTLVMTKMITGIMANKEITDRWLSRTPHGRIAEVDDIAHAITYLLSDKSDMINGHHLAIDGGYRIS